MIFMMVLLVIHILLAWLFASALRKHGRNYFFAVFCIAAVIPVFGAVILSAAMLPAAAGKACGEGDAELDAIEKEHDVYDDCIMDYTNLMPLQDALTLKDTRKKRKILFCSLKGNGLMLYPFLLKALNDKDTEIVHYASSIITDYRQEVYENYENACRRFASNPKDNGVCREYIDTFQQLICWEERNEMDARSRRKAFCPVLEAYCSQEKPCEEKYYMLKIENEIALEEFDAAYETCTRFLDAYPESEKPYMAQLELFYCKKQVSRFMETLTCIKNKEILLSTDAAGIVSYWERVKSIEV